MTFVHVLTSACLCQWKQRDSRWDSRAVIWSLLTGTHEFYEIMCTNGPLTRHVKLWVAHAPGMPGTFSLPPRVIDPDMHHDTCVTDVQLCMPGSLISAFHWSRWWRKMFPTFPAHAQPAIYVSGRRPMMMSIYISRRNRISSKPMIWYSAVKEEPFLLKIHTAHQRRSLLTCRWEIRGHFLFVEVHF